MALALHPDNLPLRMDDDGTIRVADSRITLDVLIEDYESGISPEAIAQGLDCLQLADVYSVLAFYLRHREEVADYLRRREQEAVSVLDCLESAGMTWPDAKRILTSREENKSHAAPGD
jgi:uncharacterized protein (DUF433 family)